MCYDFSGVLVNPLCVTIFQAMLDVSADRGWLVASLQVITLLQMVVQGRWWHDSSLLTLPHIELFHLPCFRYASLVNGSYTFDYCN